MNLVAFPLQPYNEANIDSVVKTVNSNFFGHARFPDPEDKASAYFCLIIKDHPFTDGNKRTAVLWLEVFCELHNIEIQSNDTIGLDVIAISVEKSKLPIEDIIKMTKRILFNI